MSDWEEDEETVNALPLSAYFPGTRTFGLRGKHHCTVMCIEIIIIL